MPDDPAVGGMANALARAYYINTSVLDWIAVHEPLVAERMLRSMQREADRLASLATSSSEG